MQLTRAILLNVLLLVLIPSVTAFGEEKGPFGLEFGKHSKKEVEDILKGEGGKLYKKGYRIIKGDIVNPDVEGLVFKDLPIKNLTEAVVWFYNDMLFELEYKFPLSMSKDEFYIMYEQLTSKYGKPAKYVEPTLADGIALWRKKDIEIKLIAPWTSWTMQLTYTHIPLSKKASLSDDEVIKKATRKPQKGL